MYPERFEGMSVTLPQTLTVSEITTSEASGITVTLSTGGAAADQYGRSGTPANDIRAANDRNRSHTGRRQRPEP